MKERMGLDAQPKKQEDDLGYGGYKKGHGVSDEWVNRNNSWQTEQRERKEEEQDINDMWKPTKSASVKETKKYDDYSNKSEDLMGFESKPKTQPKQFDFNAMGITEQETAGHVIKKAQYIGGASKPTVQLQKASDSLIDIGNPQQQVQQLTNKFEDLFSLGESKPPAQSSGFDFDFGPPRAAPQIQQKGFEFFESREQKPVSDGFDFDFQAPAQKGPATQPKTFDFASMGQQPVVEQPASVNLMDLLDQPQKAQNVEDLLSIRQVCICIISFIQYSRVQYSIQILKIQLRKRICNAQSKNYSELMLSNSIALRLPLTQLLESTWTLEKLSWQQLRNLFTCTIAIYYSKLVQLLPKFRRVTCQDNHWKSTWTSNFEGAGNRSDCQLKQQFCRYSLLISIDTKPPSTAFDIFSTPAQTTASDDQRRIHELLKTGYSQQQAFQPDLGTISFSQPTQFQTQSTPWTQPAMPKQTVDPFADAMNNNINSLVKDSQQQSKKTGTKHAIQ